MKMVDGDGWWLMVMVDEDYDSWWRMMMVDEDDDGDEDGDGNDDRKTFLVSIYVLVKYQS